MNILPYSKYFTMNMNFLYILPINVLFGQISMMDKGLTFKNERSQGFSVFYFSGSLSLL